LRMSSRRRPLDIAATTHSGRCSRGRGADDRRAATALAAGGRRAGQMSKAKHA
jgi:hypothetical protein